MNRSILFLLACALLSLQSHTHPGSGIVVDLATIPE
jgi:hypothetical protein